MAQKKKSGKERVSAEDLFEFQIVSDPQISPDGEVVIYTQQRVDKKSLKKYTNLWIASKDKAEPEQFTYGDQTDILPCWSPDGSLIAFLSNRSNKEKPPKLFLIPRNGGEARPVEIDFDGSINQISWSPDGKKLLFLGRKTDPDVLAREKDEQLKKLGAVDRHIGRLFYKLDGFGYVPKERQHIWVIDLKTQKLKQLTDHQVFDERSPAWSPDGKTIILVSNRSENPDLNPDFDEIYTIPAGGGELSLLPTFVGQKSHPRFSPDGKWLAFFGREGDDDWYRNQSLFVAPTDGSMPPKNLTMQHDLHVDGSTINDIGGAETTPPTWSPDSQWIYFQVVKHGRTLLLRSDITGERLEEVINEAGVVASFSMSRQTNRMSYAFGTMTSPAEVFVLDAASSRTDQISSTNQKLLGRKDLGVFEEVWTKGPSGNDLQGWILKPPGFDPSQKYPSILEIHGGPLTQYGHFFMHEFYFLAANGYVVHFCNPRGGRGYGEIHAGAIWGAWGSADYDDIMAWTDYIEALPYIDKDRMGVTGGSYGGYMTVWIIGHTQRYRAAVTQRCVSNFISMWGSSDFNWIFQRPVGNKTPFENFEMHWNRSPIKYIGNAKTPTLVIHSENDMRCPIEQSEQVFVALQKLDVPSEFVRFPEEFHGLSRNGRTDRRIARLNHILRWFDTYLK